MENNEVIQEKNNKEKVTNNDSGKSSIKKAGKVIGGSAAVAGSAILGAVIKENAPVIAKAVAKKSKKVTNSLLKATGLKNKNLFDVAADIIKMIKK